MNSVSTIITPDYLPYALAMRESLLRFNKEITFYVLLTEKDIKLKAETEKNYPGTVILFCDLLCNQGIGKKIYDKYFTDHKDEFRWSMKPVLLKYLIEQMNIAKVLYLDCDLFFFNNYDFLFEKLETSHIILTPHWRSKNPHIDLRNFQNLLNDGLFNGGFIGINSEAIEIMDWWSMVCEYACIKKPEKGYFVDQAYLNIMSAMFDNVEIVRHKGCNVANWNQVECKRVLRENGEVWINDIFPIVFIHFTTSTIRGIVNGTDKLLSPYLEQYSATIKKYSYGVDITGRFKTPSTGSSQEVTKETLRSKIKSWLK